MNQKYTPKQRNQESKDAKIDPAARDPTALILPIAAITVTKNIRTSPTDLEELASSIRQHGLLQPLLVSKTLQGFELIAGFRRLKSAEIAGLTEVPVRVSGATDNEIDIFRLLENLARADLDGPSEVRAVAALLPQFSGSQIALSKAISKSQTYVNRCCRAVKFLDELESYATSHNPVSKSLLFQIADSKDPRKLMEAIKAGSIKTVKEAQDDKIKRDPKRDSSGPVQGGRYVANAFKMSESKPGIGTVSIKLAYCPDRTPPLTRAAMIEGLKRLLTRLETDADINTEKGEQK
jgi:ParB family chromosome partitioning protein